MKLLTKIILTIIVAAQCSLSVQANDLIEPYCLVNGDTIALDQPIYSDDAIIFKAIDPETALNWKISLILEGDKIGSSNDILINESSEPNAEYSFNINSVNWSQFESKRISTDEIYRLEEGYTVIGYRLSVSASSENEVQSYQFVYALPLIPPNPVLLSYEMGEIDFNYETNNYRNIVPFQFTCRAEGAERYYVFLSYDHLFMNPEKEVMYYFEYPCEADEEGNLNFLIPYSEWGQFIAVYANNEYGWSGKLLMNTTDFITDPDIIARIEELREQAYPGTAVESVQESPLRIEQERIYMPDNVDSLMIFSMNGTCLRKYEGGGELSIEGLPSGVYIIRYDDRKGTHTIKYLKR